MASPDAKIILMGVFALLAAGLAAYIAFLPSAPCAGCNANVQFVFSPNSEGDVISFIRSAQKTIDVEIYTFSSQDIIRELGEAQKRGVVVRVIMEPRVDDSRKAKVFATLEGLGVQMKWASLEYKLTHSKFIIVDGKKALVGSINLSDSALNYNREADAIVEGDVVREIRSVFETDWAKATEGTGSGANNSQNAPVE